MYEHNETILYERIHELINLFVYVQEEGLEIEMKEIFYQLHAASKVKNFTLFFDSDTRRYRVIMLLEECNLTNAHTIFMSLVQFVSYSGAILSAKRHTEKGIHYEYASFSEDGRGFCIELDFFPEDVGL